VNPVTEAVLASVSDALANFRDCVEGVSAEGLNWRPGRKTNSIASQVAHALDSSRFWLEAAARPDADRIAYLERREEAFNFGADRFALLAMLDVAERQFADLLMKIEAESLADTRHWAHVQGQQPRTVAWCLVHAAEHLREHVGSAMLTRQLWLQHQDLTESLHRR
jgi:hypothetical protein